MIGTNLRDQSRNHRAFTLIELVAVMVVLAVLSAVAIPKYFDYADKARESADKASIAAIETALGNAQVQHRIDGAPNSQWVTNVSMIAPLMETNELPSGITISGNFLKDQRGNTYLLIAETKTTPARFIFISVNNGWS